ncbi:hypothetical protein G4O51_05175 [Candidatus Bathyarchaeota archaeon A05DMB-2]|jgi:hypothetical protein|nr:hypothetical protein [Candidatus Bathyarchaeota archaeon A05DMB-2]
MSEVEDAATTVARLLRTQMRVVKDDGALASVTVTGEWQNADAFKNCDGQVTVGLAESTDQKIELTGKTRRRLLLLRVNVWATDAASASEAGKVMRGKIVEEINRILRQNRSKPNETLYDLFNAGPITQTHKAYSGTSEASPAAGDWTELSGLQYQQLWYSDDNRCQVSRGGNGEYAAMMLRFRVESREKSVKKMLLTFEGYGTAPGGSGVAVKVWNHSASAWQNAQTGGTGGVDETITIALVSNLADYIDDDGYVWLLARTLFASDGATPAVLWCDYACCAVTVNGITYCDVSGYRNLDRVDTKPFIYRTEFTVKSWFFENIGV